MDTSIGAFVLPNAVIPDDTPLEIFKVPGQSIAVGPSKVSQSLGVELTTSVLSIVDAVERAAGLSLFDSVTKTTSKDLCRTVKCNLVVRRFDDVSRKASKADNLKK